MNLSRFFALYTLFQKIHIQLNIRNLSVCPNINFFGYTIIFPMIIGSIIWSTMY